MGRYRRTAPDFEIKKLELDRDGKKVLTKSMWKNSKSYYEINDCIGDRVYCKTDFLKDFTKGHIYEIEKIGVKAYNFGKIKVKGVPGYFDVGNYASFDFLENNVGLMRDFKIDELMDVASVKASKLDDRKINTLPFKNRILAQSFINQLNDYVGESGHSPSKSLKYDKIVELAINRRGYKMFQMTEEDYKDFGNLTIKELVDTFIPHLD